MRMDVAQTAPGAIASDVKTTESSQPPPLAEFRNAQVGINGCAFTGPSQDGIHILDGADVEARVRVRTDDEDIRVSFPAWRTTIRSGAARRVIGTRPPDP